MPRRPLIDRARIIGAAFELLRKKGPRAIRARTIATKLNCSTQPIYSVFRGMSGLERALLREVRRYYRQYLARDHGGATPFENIGLGYLRFAREEPRLFNWLLGSGRLKVDFDQQTHSPEVQFGLDQMANDPSLSGLSARQIQRLQRNLWIYTHGLAVLVSSGILTVDPAGAKAYMNEMAEIAISSEHLRKPRS